MSQNSPDNIMVDIETMGKLPTAPVVSIGAVRFDPHADDPENTIDLDGTFYRNISLSDTARYARVIEAETVEWWFEQSEEARKALLVDRVPMHDALLDFSLWITRMRRLGEPLRLWAHSPSFDLVILESSFQAIGTKTPWTYREERDTRTVYDLGGVDLKAIPRLHGVEHDALADAAHQALGVREAYLRLGFAQGG